MEAKKNRTFATFPALPSELMVCAVSHALINATAPPFETGSFVLPAIAFYAAPNSMLPLNGSATFQGLKFICHSGLWKSEAINSGNAF